MEDKEKLQIFEEHIDKIQSSSIREFTKFCILNFPEYFFSLPASTMGKHHGKNETLIDHVLGCLKIADKVCNEQFKDHWSQKIKDQLRSALLCHDAWRAGEPGEELTITQEDIDTKGLSQEMLGNFKTSRDHPLVGYRQILYLAIKYNKYAIENKLDVIGAHNIEMIAKSVKYHYGPFLAIKENPFNPSLPFDSVIVQTHNIDYMQSLSAHILTRKEIK